MSPQLAETLALQALTWLIGDDDLRAVFLGATGADPAELAARAGETELLVSVLDFLLMDDRAILRFAEESGCQPDEPAAAHAVLSGAAMRHWT